MTLPSSCSWLQIQTLDPLSASLVTPPRYLISLRICTSGISFIRLKVSVRSIRPASSVSSPLASFSLLIAPIPRSYFTIIWAACGPYCTGWRRTRFNGLSSTQPSTTNANPAIRDTCGIMRSRICSFTCIIKPNFWSIRLPSTRMTTFLPNCAALQTRCYKYLLGSLPSSITTHTSSSVVSAPCFRTVQYTDS